jgi:subtilisin family serine protease
VAENLASLGAGARPLAGAAAGRGVSVALLDGPVDSGHPYLHQPGPGWNAINGKPQTAEPGPEASAHGTAMAGIVVGRDGPAGLHGVAPQATLLPIQVMELQHGDLIGTTATLLAGLDRALDPNGDGNLSDHADVILAPVAEPFAAFGASAETVAAEGVERAGAVLVAAAGNDGPTGARFGTIASPAASPGWLAIGASDGRVTLPSTSVALTTDGVAATIGTAPLAGALKPASGAPLPLVLPAGPTQSDPSRAPADVVAGTDEGDFIVDGTSLVKGKAVLLPRDGATITQRAAAASAAGASALVLYGDGGVPAGALGLDDRVTLPVIVIPGEQGAAAAGTLLTGGAVSVTFGEAQTDSNPDTGSIAAFSSTGLAFDDSVKPDLVAPGVAVTSSAPGGGYLAQSGTSVAAAQVAGAAALVRQAHPAWSPRLVRGALVGTAKAVGGGGEGDGPAPVEAQGAGAVDVAAATAATVVAEPASLTFGLARAPDVSVQRVLTLANTGTETVHVSVSLSRDGNGDDGSSVELARPPSALAIAPGATVPVPLTLKASGLPHETAVIGGWLLVASAGGETLRVPWALARSDELAAGLIGDAALVPPLVQPATDGNPVAKLTLVLGSASSDGAARLEIAPVQRLSVDLYRDSRLLGRVVERHELLPGSYRYGITGIDPSTGKPLTPGVYRLVIDAVSSDDVTSERKLGFTVAG